MKKKSRGMILCRPVKVWPDFLDATCYKTGREITFQFRYPLTDRMKDYIESVIEKEQAFTILCEKQEDEGMYWFLCLSGKQYAARRERMKKIMAFERLQEECAKDSNPAGTGTHGTGMNKGALHNTMSTSANIGGSLLRYIRDPLREEFRDLERTRDARKKQMTAIDCRINRVRNNYRRWRKKNYGTIQEFLKIYMDSGPVQHELGNNYFQDIKELARLRVIHKRWKEVCRLLGIRGINARSNTITGPISETRHHKDVGKIFNKDGNCFSHIP